MSFWVLLQVLVNLILVAGIVGLWIRLNRPAKDDPRLSKGLQLLQSKIAILEDLSDRTETQVTQLTALLEQKCKDIQAKVIGAEKQIALIDQSMQKSLEVAKIFQDRIPHSEILERQSTIKYVKAARLAHQGLSADQIALQVDLSRGEIEMIAKVNKDQLMFCEDSLPEWVGDEAKATGEEPDQMQAVDLKRSLQREPIPEFNEVIKPFFEAPAKTETASPKSEEQNAKALKKLGEAFKAAESIKAKAVDATGPNIRPVQFRRIDMAKDLR